MSKPPILQLIYTSTAVEPFSPEQLAELLADARARNTALGISGLLVHDAGFFIQALEGPDAAVTALFNKIAADPRHGEVRVLYRDFEHTKEFDSWAMGFVDAASASAAEGAILAEQLQEVVADKSRAKTLIRMFMEGDWRRKIRAD